MGMLARPHNKLKQNTLGFVLQTALWQRYSLWHFSSSSQNFFSFCRDALSLMFRQRDISVNKKKIQIDISVNIFFGEIDNSININFSQREISVSINIIVGQKQNRCILKYLTKSHKTSSSFCGDTLLLFENDIAETLF